MKLFHRFLCAAVSHSTTDLRRGKLSRAPPEQPFLSDRKYFQLLNWLLGCQPCLRQSIGGLFLVRAVIIGMAAQDEYRSDPGSKTSGTDMIAMIFRWMAGRLGDRAPINSRRPLVALEQLVWRGLAGTSEALLEKGIYYVCMDVNDMLGSPQAVKHWNVYTRR